jgi:hypothetical protein
MGMDSEKAMGMDLLTVTDWEKAMDLLTVTDLVTVMVTD